MTPRTRALWTAVGLPVAWVLVAYLIAVHLLAL